MGTAPPRRTRRLVLAVVILGALATTAPLQARAQGSLEYPVKAAYLYKFGPFVEWPPAAFSGPAEPVNLCIVGDDPFGALLDRSVEGKTVGLRPIRVRRLARLDRESGCHIAYIAGSVAQPAAEALANADGVLTVTDAAAGQARGIIHFAVKDNRVRFHIDDAAAARSGIAISSKLLSLALSVRTRSRG